MKARRAAAAALMLVLAFALGSCARIPTSGPVFKEDSVTPTSGGIFLRAAGPLANGSPEQIVIGFLSAQTAGTTAGFGVARDFLAGAAASSWDPAKRVIVYDGDLTLATDPGRSQRTGVAIVQAKGSVVASVDSRGIYTEVAKTPTQLTFDLTRGDDGQWRIDKADDGVVMSSTNFASIYRPTTLYFPSDDLKFLVPDVRWFPKLHWQTYAVAQTLAGPAPWLAQSVAAVVPDGTSLASDSIATDGSGSIAIPLNAAAEQLTKVQRGLLTAQLQATLSSDSVERRVSLYVGDTALLGGDPPALTAYRPSRQATGISNGRVVRISTDGNVTVAGSVQPVADLGPTALAVGGQNPGVVVLRSGTDDLVTAPMPGAQSETLLTGEDLVAPSVDRYGDVWSGPSEQGRLIVIHDSEPHDVSVPWLADREILSIRVAPEGARIAIVSRGVEGVRVDVAGIVRHRAVPSSLSEPVQVGKTIAAASQVVWTGEADLGVLGRSANDTQTAVVRVPVTGPSSQISAVDGAVRIAAAGDIDTLLATTATGELFSYSETSLWTPLASKTYLATYPG